jgi:hypothetical protein
MDAEGASKLLWVFVGGQSKSQAWFVILMAFAGLICWVAL